MVSLFEGGNGTLLMTLSVVDGLAAGGGPLLVALALLLTDILANFYVRVLNWL
jgi:hypothetical protein